MCLTPFPFMTLANSSELNCVKPYAAKRRLPSSSSSIVVHPSKRVLSYFVQKKGARSQEQVQGKCSDGQIIFVYK